MQIAIVGLAGCRQDHRVQHAHAGPRRDRRVRRAPAERRRGQGARRAARRARRGVQAQEDRPRRRHLRRPARRRRRRPRAASAPRSCRRSTSPGSATPTRCSTSCEPSGPGGQPHPDGIRRRRPATSSSWTSSSSSPTSRWSSGASSGCAAPGATGRRPSARRTSASWSILERLMPALEAGPPIRDVELDADEEKAIRGFRFLTQKPVLVLLNIGEGDIAAAPDAVAADRAPATRTGTRWWTRCRRGSRWSWASSSRRGGRVHGGAGLAESSLERVIALSLPAARADLVPHRRPRRDPRLADPRRLDRGRCRGRDPHRPRARLHPRRDVAYEDLLALGSIAEAARTARCARRARPTGCATATSSRSCSAALTASAAGAEPRRSAVRSRASFGRPPSACRGRRGSSRSRHRRRRSARRRGRRGSSPPPRATR